MSRSMVSLHHFFRSKLLPVSNIINRNQIMPVLPNRLTSSSVAFNTIFNQASHDHAAKSALQVRILRKSNLKAGLHTSHKKTLAGWTACHKWNFPPKIYGQGLVHSRQYVLKTPPCHILSSRSLLDISANVKLLGVPVRGFRRPTDTPQPSDEVDHQADVERMIKKLQEEKELSKSKLTAEEMRGWNLRMANENGKIQ